MRKDVFHFSQLERGSAAENGRRKGSIYTCIELKIKNLFENVDKPFPASPVLPLTLTKRCISISYSFKM